MESNVQSIREALIKVRDWMEHRIITCGFEPSPTFPTILEDVVYPALSKTPRNCDVGTPEEQQERFKDFCRREDGGTCLCCPAASFEDCVLGWAQLPYESEGTNGK